MEHSEVPTVILDDERRYRDANPAARLVFRMSLDEIRGLRVDEITPPGLMPVLERVWNELVTAGTAAGSYDIVFEDGSHLNIVYWARAKAVEGLHLGVFAPAGWPEHELVAADPRGAGEVPELSKREIEVLRLAAEGASGPQIARRLGISPTTVKTHFANIYGKLDVRDRAAAVATALRLGLIE
jgi:DNA-binding CsgD family transcriptional regulator